MSKSTKDTIAGIVGAILIFAVVAVAVSSCSGCAAPAAADDSRVKSAAEAGIDALGDDKPQESAAPPAELPAEPAQEPVKYFPPEDPAPAPYPLPTTRRVLCFTDPQTCAPCVREEPEFAAMRQAGWSISTAERQHIKIVNLREHHDWHRQYQVTALPTFVLLIDGQEADRHVGFLDRWQLDAFWRNLPGYEQANANSPQPTPAPEVAQTRPFSEPWRAQLPWHIRQSVHTNLDVATVALPTTRINLRSQSVEFSGEPVRSRLNRWFSVSFGPGEVSHEGTTVKFSSPPELHFHLLDDGRKGVRLDSLEAIELNSGKIGLRMQRFGLIEFKVP